MRTPSRWSISCWSTRASSPEASISIDSPAVSRPLTRACRGRSTSIETRGRLRHPSSATTASSESHSTCGLTKAVGSESGPAWKTSTLRSIPTCVAASPTPIASRMIAIIRSTSARSSGPNSVTGEALLFSTGSPNLTTSASAASRRSSSSASSSLSFVLSRSRCLIVAHASIVWIG